MSTFTDSQVHFWPDSKEPLSAELEKRLAGQGGLSPVPEDTIRVMQEAGIERAVIVPLVYMSEDNDHALGIAREYPEHFAVMGRLDLEAPGEWTDLSGWLAQPGMLGVRTTFTRGPSQDYLYNNAVDWFWSQAEEFAIPLMIYPTGQQLLEIGNLADRYPNLKLIVDHAALPTVGAGEVQAEVLEHFAKIAGRPNISVKASAIPNIADEPFPFPTAVNFVRQLVNAFGVERVYWGSDHTRVRCTYLEGATYLKESGEFNEQELDWIMGRGISEALSWPGPE